MNHVRDQHATTGTELAFGGFAGSHKQLRELLDCAPTYVEFRRGMFRAAETADSKKRLMNLLATCQSTGAKVLVDGGSERDARKQWREFGVDLVMTTGTLNKKKRDTLIRC